MQFLQALEEKVPRDSHADEMVIFATRGPANLCGAFFIHFPPVFLPCCPGLLSSSVPKRLCCACGHMRRGWLTAEQAAGPASPEPGPLCRLNRVPPWESRVGSPLPSPSATFSDLCGLTLVPGDSYLHHINSTRKVSNFLISREPWTPQVDAVAVAPETEAYEWPCVAR